MLDNRHNLDEDEGQIENLYYHFEDISSQPSMPQAVLDHMDDAAVEYAFSEAARERDQALQQRQAAFEAATTSSSSTSSATSSSPIAAVINVMAAGAASGEHRSAAKAVTEVYAEMHTPSSGETANDRWAREVFKVLENDNSTNAAVELAREFDELKQVVLDVIAKGDDTEFFGFEEASARSTIDEAFIEHEMVAAMNAPRRPTKPFVEPVYTPRQALPDAVPPQTYEEMQALVEQPALEDVSDAAMGEAVDFIVADFEAGAISTHRGMVDFTFSEFGHRDLLTTTEEKGLLKNVYPSPPASPTHTPTEAENIGRDHLIAIIPPHVADAALDRSQESEHSGSVMAQEAVFEASRDGPFVYYNSLDTPEGTLHPTPTTTFNEFNERGLLTSAEFDSAILAGIYESMIQNPQAEVTLAEAEAPGSEAFLDEMMDVTMEALENKSMWVSPDDGAEVMVESEVEVRAGWDEEKRKVIEEAQVRLVADDVERASREKADAVDLIIEMESVGDMYGRLTATGAVDSEEVLTILMKEARRIQWDRAVADAARADGLPVPAPVKKSETSTSSSSLPSSGRNVSSADNARLLGDVYQNMSPAGIDADTALEGLLKETMRMIEIRAAQKKAQKALADAKIKAKL
ncbi:hypothetical protein HDU76_006370 [Blyttiomyces sp. JEL0837]|nr:hypothetical protein HDU76_006370 [Blyttiomyces sp. JEL0837]